MTMFILHGGLPPHESQSNREFYQLMADYVPNGGTWLGCYFASLSEKQALKYALDCERMQTLGGGRFLTSMATVQDFPAQVKAADVIYFAGGSTAGLMNQISLWPDLPVWLRRKRVVAGSSAGMNMLGLRYFSKDGSSGTGLGLVPYNMLVHHRAEGYRAVHDATPMPPPVLALHEMQFCVVES